MTIDTSTNPTAARLRARILAALTALPKVKISTESTDADWEVEQVRVELESLGNTTPGVDISDEEAITELNRLRAELRKMSTRTDSIRLQTATLAALAELDKFRPPPPPQHTAYNDEDIATYYGSDKPPKWHLIAAVLVAMLIGALLVWLLSAGTAGTTY